MQDVTKACENADQQMLKNLAHQLKGACGSAGFAVLAQQAAQLETLVVSRELDSAKKTVDELNQLCRELTTSRST